MDILLDNYPNDYVIPFKKTVLGNQNETKQDFLCSSSQIQHYPSLNNFQAYSLSKSDISFGGNSSYLKERASRLLIRCLPYPEEIQSDMLWALGLDKIIRKHVIHVKKNSTNSIEDLTTSLMANYTHLKQRRESQLCTSWHKGLSDRDKKISEYIHSIGFDRSKLDFEKLSEIVADDNGSPKPGELGELLGSYDFIKLQNIDIIGQFVYHRYKHGIDPIGIDLFGPKRPINDPFKFGTITVSGMQWEKYGGFKGRRFAKYARAYENPETLKSFKKLPDIKIEDWDSQDNPISAVINEYDLNRNYLPHDCQSLSVYTYDKPSAVEGSPMASTTVIFANKQGEKPELTAVIWKMPDAEHFPAIQNHLNGLYSEYLQYKDMPNSSEKREKIIGIAAEIQWYFHQMMPYKRGSAALGDALARTLMESTGLELSRWKAGVLPDIETFVTDLPTFKQKYSQLFETSPTFSKKSTSSKKSNKDTIAKVA